MKEEMSAGLFKNKYRIKSARRDGYDYSRAGRYFVTICTDERQGYFGIITDGKMILNQLGKMADKYWREITNHFPFVRLDEYVVMPNHVHGIIVIDRGDDGGTVETPNLGVSTDNLGVSTDNLGVSTDNLGVSTDNDNRKTSINKIYGATAILKHPYGGHKPQWKPGTLGVILNQYKRKCKIEMRKIIPDFAWQTRFYDRIIRDEKSLNKIRQYIINNPAKWEQDRNNDENIWI